MKQAYRRIIFTLLVFWAGYEAHNNKLFPINQFLNQNIFTKVKDISGLHKRVDVSAVTREKLVGVFTNISKKKEITCPSADNSLVVIGFGQSNSANHAGHRFASLTPNIVNFFNGKCYQAADPMLGSTGRSGSPWIPLAKQLASSHNSVVVATFGIGGTKVEEWLDPESLLPFYSKNIASLQKVYPNPDIAIWIQGESDKGTEIFKFRTNLETWFNIIRYDLPDTDLYISGTSYCNGSSNTSNVSAQRQISEKVGATFVGSTDDLINVNYRYDDCHFSEQGVRALVEILSGSITK